MWCLDVVWWLNYRWFPSCHICLQTEHQTSNGPKPKYPITTRCTDALTWDLLPVSSHPWSVVSRCSTVLLKSVSFHSIEAFQLIQDGSSSSSRSSASRTKNTSMFPPNKQDLTRPIPSSFVCHSTLVSRFLNGESAWKTIPTTPSAISLISVGRYVTPLPSCPCPLTLTMVPPLPCLRWFRFTWTKNGC